MCETYPQQIKIVEVGPRDGLQNEAQIIPATVKVALIDHLGRAGIKYIEASSFVHPKRIPQLADAEEVFNTLPRIEGIHYSALVPNIKGMQRAIDANVDSIAVFTAASETFCQRNIQCSIAESLERFSEVFKCAKTHQIPVRGYISCALGCPYEGEVAQHQVVELAKSLIDMGCYEISVGDTIGIGTPFQARNLIRALKVNIPLKQVAVHFHNTRGQALANILICLQEGIEVIDSAVAGLGGCPYASGASGNVASEDVVYMLHGMGIDTGIDLNTLIHAGNFISEQLQRQNNSLVSRARR